MSCAPAPMLPAPKHKSDGRERLGGAWGAAADPIDRTFENLSILWTAPWRAYWALAFEALDPANYRR